MGAAPETRRGVPGVCFRLWAPNAERVSVVGEFNRWDGRTHPMCALGASGAWELFIPEVPAGSLYKFEIRNRHTGAVMVKADPYAREFEKRPATAARVPGTSAHGWTADAGPTGCTRRCRSTRCTWAPGCAIRTTASTAMGS
jgi:1,4-alpha-glucan branching enzyme